PSFRPPLASSGNWLRPLRAHCGPGILACALSRARTLRTAYWSGLRPVASTLPGPLGPRAERHPGHRHSATAFWPVAYFALIGLRFLAPPVGLLRPPAW